MNKLKIAKQIPLVVLAKRILKRVLPAQRIIYTDNELRSTFSIYKIQSLLADAEFEEIADLQITNHYINHEFDLLGSGWQNRDLKKTITFNSAHQTYHDKVIQLVSTNYQFINWQLDVISGFEFDVTKQFDQQNIGKTKNVGIKNCWELGRLQHLPQLAIAAVTAENKEKLILEFKNQCLDFISSNPVGMGVQWACAMDVGIRVSNLLVALDIFNKIDETKILTEDFNQLFANAIYQHGLFIYHHLEHKEGAAGNHYLFNLVGLLFVSNYLSESEEMVKWKRFTEYELEKEFYKQFFNDGGNFEGSTCYHCLCTEAMLYGTALLLRNGKKLSQKYINLLYHVANFIKIIAKPTHEIPQFGDNDSGRLFILDNKNKNLLNYDSLLAGFSGLFAESDFDCFSTKQPNQKLIIEHIIQSNKLPTPNTKRQTPNAKYQTPNPKLQTSIITEIKFPSNIETQKVMLYSYPNFGMLVYKYEQFYLAISTISNKKMHHGWGHVHNDKLSFELQVNGIDLVKDPGTYSYSANLEERNEFRSTKAHHGIVVEGIEQNKWLGVFYVEREVECQVLEIQDLSATLKAAYYGVEHIRKFEIFENKLVISDYCNQPFQVNINQFGKYSPSYGRSEKTK